MKARRLRSAGGWYLVPGPEGRSVVASATSTVPGVRPACAELSALFFSGDDEDVALARKLCLGCPLLPQCAARTLRLMSDRKNKLFGVWASVRLDADFRRPDRKAQRAELRAIAGPLADVSTPEPPKRRTVVVIGTHKVDAIDLIPSDRRRVYRHQRDFTVRAIA